MPGRRLAREIAGRTEPVTVPRWERAAVGSTGAASAGEELAAGAAGLELIERRDGLIDDELEGFFARAGAMGRYAADYGLAVVLALAFRRGP